MVFLSQKLAENEREVGCDLSAVAAAGDGYSCDGSESLTSSDGVIQDVEDHSKRPGEVCVVHGGRDNIIILTRRLFTQLCT